MNRKKRGEQRFSKEQLVEASAGASSMREVIENLGLKPNGGQYRYVKQYFVDAGLDYPKFDYADAAKNLSSRNKLSDDEWFSKGVFRGGPHTKKRLIKLGVKEQCSCGQGPVWMGKPLTLQVDHIDGDRFNNLISNLRILCPNCHTQTETYSSKKRHREFDSPHSDPVK